MSGNYARLIDEVRETGNLTNLQSAISQGLIKIDELVEDTSLLGFVAELGSLELTKILIESGADPNFCLTDDPDFITPLMAAVEGGNLEIVKLIVDVGAEVNYIQGAGDFALSLAARNGDRDIFNYLLPLTDSKLAKQAQKELKAVLKTKQRQNSQSQLERKLFDIVIWESTQDYQTAVSDLEKIIQKGVNVNALNEYSQTPLMRAAGRYIEIVELLLAAGADPNFCPEGIPPIVEARRNLEHLKILVAAGVDVNARVIPEPEFKEHKIPLRLYGRTVLMELAGDTPYCEEGKKYDIDKVNFLIEAGADVNLRDKNGYTALMLAAYSDYREIMQILKEAGATEVGLEIVEYHQAISNGNLAKLDEAITDKVNINCQNVNGQTLLSVAAREGKITIVEKLIAAGANLDLQDFRSETPLMKAINYPRPRLESEVIAEMLILAGTDINITDEDGTKAIEYLSYSCIPKKSRQKLRRLIKSRD